MAESQRRYERIPLELPCRLFIPDGGIVRGEAAGDTAQAHLRFEAFSVTGNMCLGGVFLVSDFLLKNGVDLMVELELPEGPLALHGRIVHVVDHDDPRDPTGMGVEFLDVSAEARETLLRYFTPERYHQFFAQVLHELPHLDSEFALSQVSLILNLWEEWKVTESGGPRATEAGAPEPPAKKGKKAPKAKR